jgi:hypothetical protein
MMGEPSITAPLGRRVAALILLCTALVCGLVSAARAAQAARTTVRAISAAPRLDGRPQLLPTARDQFVAFVVRTVPADARMQIWQPIRPPASGATDAGSGICGHNTDIATYWAFVYLLVPRASVCGGAGSWTVYLGVPVPSGPRVLRFSDTMGVVAP